MTKILMLRKFAKHKFGAKPTTKNFIRFPSRLEANCYERLQFLQQAGAILFFLRQIPVDLQGGAKHLVDFMVFTPNNAAFIEIKGKETPMSTLKRRQAEERLGVEIKVAHSIKEMDEALREMA